jgi:NAD(P)-dependent dehydrogenase (short-subunit alcohol dehydrogenase family)
VRIRTYFASKAAALTFHEALAGELKQVHGANRVLTPIVHPTYVEALLVGHAVSHFRDTNVDVLSIEEVGGGPQIANQVFARRGAQLIIPRRNSIIGLLRGSPDCIQGVIGDLFTIPETNHA